MKESVLPKSQVPHKQNDGGDHVLAAAATNRVLKYNAGMEPKQMQKADATTTTGASTKNNKLSIQSGPVYQADGDGTQTQQDGRGSAPPPKVNVGMAGFIAGTESRGGGPAHTNTNVGVGLGGGKGMFNGKNGKPGKKGKDFVSYNGPNFDDDDDHAALGNKGVKGKKGDLHMGMKGKGKTL